MTTNSTPTEEAREIIHTHFRSSFLDDNARYSAELIDAIASALKARELAGYNRGVEESQWQPIETAPQDGTEILVFTVHGEIEKSHWFVTESDEYDPVEGSDGLYRKRVNKYYEGWNSNRFTHWMPQPKPPTGS